MTCCAVPYLSTAADVFAHLCYGQEADMKMGTESVYRTVQYNTKEESEEGHMLDGVLYLSTADVFIRVREDGHCIRLFIGDYSDCVEDGEEDWHLMIALTYMSIADVFVLVEEDGHDTGVYISECCTVVSKKVQRRVACHGRYTVPVNS